LGTIFPLHALVFFFLLLEVLAELLEEAGVSTREQILGRKKVLAGRRVGHVPKLGNNNWCYRCFGGNDVLPA